MESLLRDLRYAFRMLVAKPLFTAVVVVSLALGIGANSTIFTIVNAVFLNPLPVEDSSRLVSVYTTDEKNRGGFNNSMPMSFPNYRDYRDQNDVFSGVTAFMGLPLSLAGVGQPEQINGQMVSGNYFEVLGVKPAAGRTFLPEEDRTPGTHPVAVLSHGFWKRRFGADRSAVGKIITLNGVAYSIVGVAAERFRGTNALGGPDLWVPSMMHAQVLPGPFRDWFESRRALLFGVVGRLKPGVTAEQATAALKVQARSLEQAYPRENEKRSVRLLALNESTINPNFRSMFVMAGVIMMTVVGLVLLITCANVANLLLGRATARTKEIAIRLSMGASRATLVRQLLTESVLLSLLGGACGLVVAFWSRDLIWSLRPTFLPADALNLSLDSNVLAFTFLLSVVAGVLFGLAPALQISKPDVVAALKGESNAWRPQSRFGLRNVLVVSQVALSLVSLAGAGLFIRSLRNAQQIDVGFDVDHQVVLNFSPGAQGYDEARGRQLYRRVLEKVESLPDVRSATLATVLPLAGGGMGRTVFPEGLEGSDRSGVLVTLNVVAPRYFETTGVPILRGRQFVETDRPESPRVGVINETMARRFWPDQEAIGKRFKFFGEEYWVEVVGVARDGKYFTLGEEPQPFLYLALAQDYTDAVTLMVRTAGDPARIVSSVRREVQALDPTLPLVRVSTMSDVVGQSLWAPRMGAALLAVFGLLALLLAAIGIYGVMSYAVTQRTREIGIRMALGAQKDDVLRMVVGRGALLTLIGIAVGLAATLLLARFTATLLYGSANNLPTFAVVAALLSAVAMAACYVPARRATRVDPIVALRYE